MSPRVTYWTGTWDPAKEAISKEVNALRAGPRARAPVVAFSPGHTFRLHTADRVLMLPGGRSWPILRGVAAVLERRGDISHVFGGSGVSWHVLRALGRRPVLLTAVTGGPHHPDGLPPTKIARVAAETEDAVEEWVGAGVPREHIEIVRPGIDLSHFAPTDPPSGRFTLLFASTPSDAADIGPRGIPLLVELARHRPDVDIILPWRAWGDVDAARLVLGSLDPPPNFLVEVGNLPDMRAQYARAHATIVCFEPGIGKAIPNFVLEGLAAGRPCLSVFESGLAADLERSGAGLTASRDVAALSLGVDRLKADWQGYSVHARQLAVARFSLEAFRATYERLYQEIAVEASRSGR